MRAQRASVTEWRSAPRMGLPHFDDIAPPARVADGIWAEFVGHLVRALSDLAPVASREAKAPDAHHGRLAALLSCRYGAIYWLTPSHARHLSQAARDDAARVDDFAQWLTHTGWHNRVFNRAVAAYLRSGRLNLGVADGRAPRQGFQVLDGEHVCARHATIALTPAAAGASRRALFDLHDFAHLAAARLSHELYGVKAYSPGTLMRLPPDLRALVAGFDAEEQSAHADGTIFSVVLHDAFFFHELHHVAEESAVRVLTDAAIEYLLDDERPIGVAALAVNAQNQAYEAPATEIEQLLFTRGGTDGRDELEVLSPTARLARVANLQERTYHERRNVAKRRAQRAGYRAVAVRYAAEHARPTPDRRLAAAVARSLDFRDYRQGRRLNLFEEVVRRLTSAATD